MKNIIVAFVLVVLIILVSYEIDFIQNILIGVWSGFVSAKITEFIFNNK